MSLTFLAKSCAYSWKMSLAGQVLWKRSVVVCAVEAIGKARTPAPTAPAEAFLRKRRRWLAILLMGSPVCRWQRGDAGRARECALAIGFRRVIVRMPRQLADGENPRRRTITDERALPHRAAAPSAARDGRNAQGAQRGS